MEETPSQRLKIILDLLEISFREFARRSGNEKLMDQGAKYVGEGKKSTLGKRFKDKFQLCGINYNWYLTGEGRMFSENQLGNLLSDKYHTKLAINLHLSEHAKNEYSSEEQPLKIAETTAEYLTDIQTKDNEIYQLNIQLVKKEAQIELLKELLNENIRKTQQAPLELEKATKRVTAILTT
jgi:hypothetical protein